MMISLRSTVSVCELFIMMMQGTIKSIKNLNSNLFWISWMKQIPFLMLGAVWVTLLNSAGRVHGKASTQELISAVV